MSDREQVLWDRLNYDMVNLCLATTAGGAGDLKTAKNYLIETVKKLVEESRTTAGLAPSSDYCVGFVDAFERRNMTRRLTPEYMRGYNDGNAAMSSRAEGEGQKPCTCLHEHGPRCPNFRASSNPGDAK